MKKLRPFVCLLSLVILPLTARAEVPDAATTIPPGPQALNSTAGPDAAAPAVDPAKVAEIRKLLELVGTVKMTHQMMNQMISTFRMQNNDVPSEFWDRFEKEMNLQDLIDKIIPVYAKYYSLDDLKAVNAFYQSPVGQRMLASTPQILQESMQIGQDWGRGVATRLMAELQEEKEKKNSNAAPSTTTPSTTTAPAAGATK